MDSGLAARLKADVGFRDMQLILVSNGPDADLEARLKRGELQVSSQRRSTQTTSS